MPLADARAQTMFQSPRGDFGFLKGSGSNSLASGGDLRVSIPSRGFWFFEAFTTSSNVTYEGCFNPLAGILVF